MNGGGTALLVNADKQERMAEQLAYMLECGQSQVVLSAGPNVGLDDAVRSALIMGWSVVGTGHDQQGEPIVVVGIEDDSPMRRLH